MNEKREVFICYAHEDEPLRQSLEKHLQVLQRQNLIAVWHDRKIRPGTDWEQEIDTALNHAHIVLLLVSPDFMASDYCYGVEMEHALQRHEQGFARVLPIILRPVHWQTTPLGKLQALPTDAKPIVSSSWYSQDEAFYNVAEGIRIAIKELAIYPQIASLTKQSLPQESIGQLFGEGKVLYAQGHYEEALHAFNRILLLEPENGEAHSWKGGALFYLERYEEALTARSEALRYNSPFHTGDWASMGWTLYQLQRYKEALTDFDQSIQFDPSSDIAYRGKGWALYRLQQYEKAITAFDQAIQLLGSTDSTLCADAYGGKGWALYRLQQYEEAITAFNQAIQLNPNYTDAYSGKAEAILQQQKKKAQ